MADIELFFGNVTTRGSGSLTVVALYRKNAQTKQQTIGAAVMDSKSDAVSLGFVDRKNSSSNNRPGTWSKTRVKLPEGSFVEFQMMRSMGTSAFGGGTSAIVIRARSDGPLQRIGIDFPMDLNSTEAKGYIEGRFDILLPDEIEELGVNCDKVMSTYDPEEYENHVTVEVLEREFRARAKISQSPAKAKVLSSKGGTKTVLRVKRIRRLNVGS